MNNKIRESYCSIEVSQMLKEEGFEVPCHYYFDKDGNEHGIEEQSDYSKMFHKLPDAGKGTYRPTHALAIEWIMVNFRIWFQITPYDTITSAKEWTFTLLSLEWGEDKEIHYEKKMGGFKTPQEATEAALLYTLQNLIK